MRPAVLLNDVRERPLRYIGPLHLAASATLVTAFGLSNNPYLMSASAIGLVNHVIFTFGGDGGDQTKRTLKQRRRAARFEWFAQLSTIAGGSLYAASSCLAHGGAFHPSELAIGVLGVGGAAIGIRSRRQAHPGTVKAALGQLRRWNVRKAAGEIARLQPYQKSSLCWTTANALMVPVYLNTQNPLVLVALGFNLAANRLIYLSEKAEPTRSVTSLAALDREVAP